MIITDYNIFLKKGNCSHCSNCSFVIHRKYSGERLCPECFTNSIEKNIYQTISKYKMLKPQDKIIVALSGGKDSIALLYNLIQIQNKKHRSEPLIALTINEGIKDYREHGLKIARKFCRLHDIEHVVISSKEEVGSTLDEIVKLKKVDEDYVYACNYCATIRRRLLNDGARKLGGNILAMGHNLTDLAETYLMNIVSNRYKLIANQYLFKQESNDIRQFFVKKISPLMRIPEEEIYLYSNIEKLDYYPSHCPNREKEPILRKRVLDFIQECKKYTPEIEFNLLNGFLELSEILYKQSKKTSYNSCKKCGYPSGNNELCTYCKLKDTLIK